MEWSSSKMKYESNCCTSGSIYDPWSSSLCWQTLILAGAGMVLHFFLISGWFMPSFGTWKPSDGLAHFHLDRAVTGVTCQSFSFDNWPALTAFCLAWRRGSTGNTHSKPGPVIRSTPTSGVTFHHVTVQPVTWRSAWRRCHRQQLYFSGTSGQARCPRSSRRAQPFTFFLIGNPFLLHLDLLRPGTVTRLCWHLLDRPDVQVI